MFVKGYKDASIVLEDMRNEPLSPNLQEIFKLQFQRLVVLDYIIRNTGNIIIIIIIQWNHSIKTPLEPAFNGGILY